jgi:hypothetical protein
MDLKLLYAKDAIFALIAQFHRASKFDDGELYIYNYCESALESAFNVLGIEENYIKLMDFCKMWEDNSRAIWAIDFPDEPYDSITADIHYQVFKEDYDDWKRVLDYLNEDE